MLEATVLLHEERGAVPARGQEAHGRFSGEDGRRAPSSSAGGWAGMLHRSRSEADRFIIRDKVCLVSNAVQSPVGRSVVEAAGGRADRSEAYRDARAEYARIRALREVSPIAAHLRERRFELGLTQEEVAKAAGTSHSAVSRLEKGTHIPQLPTLQRVAAVLDEDLLVCFQRTVDGEVEREFAAVA
jgi:DNA-binding XRE family transcriptional regulator